MQTLWKIVWRVLRKLKVELTTDKTDVEICKTVSGTTTCQKSWEYNLGKGYNSYIYLKSIKDFSGKVCLEVWENINSIEKIISVEPSSNKMQESTDWKSIYEASGFLAASSDAFEIRSKI